MVDEEGEVKPIKSKKLKKLKKEYKYSVSASFKATRTTGTQYETFGKKLPKSSVSIVKYYRVLTKDIRFSNDFTSFLPREQDGLQSYSL